jgi:hypothetical protein
VNRRKRLLAAGGLAVALVALGGTALAATPSPVNGNVITGCYTNAAVNGSHALVLQNAGTSCPSGTSAIMWGVTGPAGANGTSVTSTALAPGANSNCPNGGSSFTSVSGTTYACNGATGPPGTSVTSNSLAPGANSNCPNGGSSFTVGAGTPTYACNGAPGAQGPAGPVDVDYGELQVFWIEPNGPGNPWVYDCDIADVQGPDQNTLALNPASSGQGCYLTGFSNYVISLQLTPTGLFGASPPVGCQNSGQWSLVMPNDGSDFIMYFSDSAGSPGTGIGAECNPLTAGASGNPAYPITGNYWFTAYLYTG